MDHAISIEAKNYSLALKIMQVLLKKEVKIISITCAPKSETVYQNCDTQFIYRVWGTIDREHLDRLNDFRKIMDELEKDVALKDYLQAIGGD